MRASGGEFKYRFWIISAIFTAGFCAYYVDPITAATVLGESNARAALAAGALLVTAGAALRTWATAYLRSDVVQDTRLHTDALVADGPYRYLRNPLYLGTLLLAVGMGLVASRAGFLIMTSSMLIFVLRLIGREEGELSATQGDAYRAYLQTVPSLIPAVRPRLPPSGLQPRWGQALVGELYMWGFAGALGAFAVTLRQQVLWIGLVVAALALVAGRAFR